MAEEAGGGEGPTEAHGQAVTSARTVSGTQPIGFSTGLMAPTALVPPRAAIPPTTADAADAQAARALVKRWKIIRRIGAGSRLLWSSLLRLLNRS